MGTHLEYVSFAFEGLLKNNVKEDEYHNVFMCELGNQVLKPKKPELWCGHSTGKQYFSSFGIQHTSLDTNGKHGALKINLCEPIGNQQDSLVQNFDIVTNFGTSEHVKNQFMCWKNIHDLCKDSAIMVHVVPNTNRKGRHGLCAYSIDFFLKFAEAAEYQIIEEPANRWEDVCVSTILRKKSQDFINEESFWKIFLETCKAWGTPRRKK